MLFNKCAYIECSDPLLTVDDCKNCIEIAVGIRTQWKPAKFAGKLFAVQLPMHSIFIVSLVIEHPVEHEAKT